MKRILLLNILDLTDFCLRASTSWCSTDKNPYSNKLVKTRRQVLGTYNNWKSQGDAWKGERNIEGTPNCLYSLSNYVIIS